MTRRSAGPALVLAVLTAIAAGCAAAPLPSVRPLSMPSAQGFEWDSRTCAWAAEDASGSWADLSRPENAIVGFFTVAPVRSGEWPRDIGTPEVVGPASPSPVHLGRGGRRKFEEVYRQCMMARGYEGSSRAGEEKTR